MEFLEPILASSVGPILIFCLRIVDVSMATLRTIMAVRGRRVPAMSLGFFQMLFWLLAVSGALQHINSIPHLLSYAGGFAAGNYVGVWLEQRLALGTSVVRAVMHRREEQSVDRRPGVAQELREQDFAVTELPARGWRGKVDVVDVVVPRRKVPYVVRTVAKADPEAVISVDRVEVTNGSPPVGRVPGGAGLWRRAA